MKNRGFTLIELMIVIAIVSILVATLGPVLWNWFQGASGNGDFADKPEQLMSQYMERMYPSVTNVRIMCGDMDTDGNGYVRCEAVGDQASGVPFSIDRECSATFALHNACVSPKMRITP